MISSLHLLMALSLSALQSPQPSSAQVLDDVARELIAMKRAQSPSLLLQKGLPIEALPQFSLAQTEADAARARDLLRRVDGVKESSLKHEELLSLLVLRTQLGQLAAGPDVFFHLFSITPYSSALGGLVQLFPAFPVKTAEDRARYLKLLDEVPRVAAQVSAHLDAQEQRGIRVPKAALPAIEALHRAVASASATSPFQVAPERIAPVDAKERDAFTAAVADRIDKKIVPAVSALADRIGGAYRAKAPETVGLSQYPGGRKVYDALVKAHTTMDVTAEEVHAIGLRNVERIDAEMAKIRAEVGFKGTAIEFKESLRTNPRFFPKTPDEIGHRLMSFITRIEPVLDRSFLRRPKAPYGVKRLDPQLEPGMTFGYYQIPSVSEPKGLYRYNGSNLSDRSLLNAGALAYHELAPGHHFQISLAFENAAIPEFRRESADTAYSEGWGEYAAGLAGEMGMYGDSYDRYGRLAMEMFVSVRLVVDTGMNALGWSRDRAIAFMKEHALETDTQIATETLRYSTDLPGQALAYKMGALKILELRERAKRELGASFDIRKFHDWVLSSGSLPMTALERHVDVFIATNKK